MFMTPSQAHGGGQVLCGLRLHKLQRHRGQQGGRPASTTVDAINDLKVQAKLACAGVAHEARAAISASGLTSGQRHAHG